MKKRFKLKYLAVVLVMLYIGYSLFDQEMMIIRLNKDIEKYTLENQRVLDTAASLKDEIEFAKTDEFKEKMAREKMGFIKPGETVYVINEDK